MKTLVTITRNGDAIRISKVTAHGEEVLVADAEAQALAMLLWGKLAAKADDTGGGQALLPWNTITHRLDKLITAVEKLTASTEKHAHEMHEFQIKVSAVKKPTPVVVGQ
jgi:hypothetical protein